MIGEKKIVVVMPAYNAENTLEKTYSEIPKDIVDEVIVIDDCSEDRTVHLARRLGLELHIHEYNKGYGANQKTCYKVALEHNADIIIMLHPDYQYPPKLIHAMAGLLYSDMFDVVLGSRILGGYALKGGMPLYKYISNRLLTFLENLVLNAKFSEYHTGFRAFSKEVLLNLPLLENSDDFLFDNEMLVQAVYFGYKIGEITAPSSYSKDSSSINFRRSIVYGFGVLLTTLKFLLQHLGLATFSIFDPKGKKLLIKT